MSDITGVVSGMGAVCAVKRMTRDYRNEMQSALGLLRLEEIDSAAAALGVALREGRSVFAFGNGGSAATASHFVVDLGKLAREIAGCRMRAVSLVDNAPWMTAVANDLCFEECFAEPLRVMARPGDVVVGISASGDSENMVRAFSVARDVGAVRLALVGFSGGRMADMATHRVWVESDDYGVVETAHVFIIHAMIRAARDLRKTSDGARGRRVTTPARRSLDSAAATGRAGLAMEEPLPDGAGVAL